MRCLLVPLTALALSACATVAHGPNQKIAVASEPAGATVTVACGSAPKTTAVTPATVLVERAATNCILTLSKPGYEDAQVVLERQVSRATGANHAVGGFFGIIGALFSLASHGDPHPGYDIGSGVAAGTGEFVDYATGAAYKQVPSNVTVRLTPR